MERDDLITHIAEHLAEAGFAEDDCRAVAQAAVDEAHPPLTPDDVLGMAQSLFRSLTEDRGTRDFITPGLGGKAASWKPSNLVVNWREGTWFAAGASGKSLASVLGTLVLIRAVLGLFKVPLDRREALVVQALWRHRSAPAQAVSALAPDIERAFAREGLGPPSRRELSAMIDRLVALRTVVRSGDHVKLVERFTPGLLA